MSRIHLVSAETLTPEQRVVYDRIVSGPRKTVVGPLRAALHNPELAEHWQQLGALLRYGTSLPQHLKELAILVTARRWNAILEWQIHEAAARSAGVSEDVIAAIREAKAPVFADPDHAAVYEFVRELQESGRVSDASYQAALARFKTVGVVELTALVGYYTMVAMTLNAHEIVLAGEPEAGAFSVAGPGLTSLAPARPAAARSAGDDRA